MEKNIIAMGKHLIADCKGLSWELCNDDKKVLNLLAQSAEEAGATVLNTIRYHLGHNSPPGFACVVMLDESHCSAHSYAELGLMAIDIFTCGKTDPRLVFEIFRKKCPEINLGEIDIKIIDRFLTY